MLGIPQARAGKICFMGGLVKMWTDGSCLGNPGPGGYAAILCYGKHQREVVGNDPQTTNNRMELMAALKGLEALTRPSRVALATDSTYVIQGITRWIEGWKRKGWKKIKNRDLWERLDAAREPHQVEWRWVRGHSGDPMNEQADRLAVAQAQLLQR